MHEDESRFMDDLVTHVQVGMIESLNNIPHKGDKE